MNRELVRKQAEVDIKTKALLVIEVLSFGDVKLEPIKYGELVYKFSHCALSKNCSSCDHKDWELSLESWYQQLKEMGLI